MRKLNKLTLTEAKRGLRQKEFTSVQLTTACFDQIKRFDSELKVFLTLFEKNALETAKKVDKLIAKDKAVLEKKPLLGIPYALKDNFLVKGKRTTAASKVLDDYKAHYSSTVFQKLENAGAILLGKTNLDAWCHGSSTESSAYFTTRNPHDINTLPGGSSGGSAAAVAADMCIFAIGSETAGSIRLPASWCGVVGLKPTYGRVSRYGVIAMGSSLDSPGPLTKTVADSSIVLYAISGKDKFDATTSERKVEEIRNFPQKLDGVRIGLPREYFMKETQEGINELVKKEIKKLESLGAVLVEVSLMDPKYSIADYTIIQRAEVSSNLGRYDGIRYGNDRSCFGQEAKKRVMLGTYALSSGYYDAYYKKAQKVRMLMKNDFDKVFKKVDLLVSPTTASVALPVGSSKNHPMFGEVMDLLLEASSLIGLTGITVPVGVINNLPVGMQFIAPHFRENNVLAAGNAYEIAFGKRYLPRLNYE